MMNCSVRIFSIVILVCIRLGICRLVWKCINGFGLVVVWVVVIVVDVKWFISLLVNCLSVIDVDKVVLYLLMVVIMGSCDSCCVVVINLLVFIWENLCFFNLVSVVVFFLVVSICRLMCLEIMLFLML